MPSGQSVADAIGAPILKDTDILIGQAVGTTIPNIVDAAGTIFAGNCPLWTYILAEAIQNQTTVTIPVTEQKQITTPQLGPVGGRIVAEVFLGLMFADPGSYLSMDATWNPPSGKGFALKDFVQFALG